MSSKLLDMSFEEYGQWLHEHVYKPRLTDEERIAQLEEQARKTNLWSVAQNCHRQIAVIRANMEPTVEEPTVEEPTVEEMTPEEQFYCGFTTEDETIYMEPTVEEEIAYYDGLSAPEVNMEQVPYIDLGQSPKEIVKSARDLVYGTQWRGSMYMDVIQDIVDLLSEFIPYSRAYLGEWNVADHGAIFDLHFTLGDCTEEIAAYVYTLADDNGDYRGYTLLVEDELLAFSNVCWSRPRTTRLEEARIRSTIWRAHFAHRALVLGNDISAHLRMLIVQTTGIWEDAIARDEHNQYGLLNLCSCNARLISRDYATMLTAPHLYKSMEAQLLRDLRSVMMRLLDWLEARRLGIVN